MRTYTFTETVEREVTEAEALDIIARERAYKLQPVYPLGSRVRLNGSHPDHDQGVAGIVTEVEPMAGGHRYCVSILNHGCIHDHTRVEEEHLEPIEEGSV